MRNSNNVRQLSLALFSGATRLGNPLQTAVKRHSHSVRLIALEDLPHGKGYKGDVLTVKAGFARNYLIPQKKAVYATPQNFGKIGIIDPDLETEEQRIARLQRESSVDLKFEQYLKEADMLKKYLRNKVVSPMMVKSLFLRFIAVAGFLDYPQC
jgi:Ribosomal protein L9, N-terminal domain